MAVPAAPIRPNSRTARAGNAAAAARPARLHICLAGSGGGHVRQLLDLGPVWRSESHFFICDDTPLARSISAEHKVFFVDHWALGQAKIGRPLRMLKSFVKNFFQSIRIILTQRPTHIISTGAGTVFFPVLLAKLLGARVVVIETFARFDRPSRFGRVAGRIAHHRIVQSEALKSFWPDAEVFNPLRILPGPRPQKEALLFVTVGATLSFDRLVRMVAEAKAQGSIGERVLVQTGVGGARCDGLETVETLSFEEMQALLHRADLVVCHGGTGSLITALREGCRVVAVPRLHRLGEVYDDHQQEITDAFAARGLIEVANDASELSRALERARRRNPLMATSDASEMVEHLQRLVPRSAGPRHASGARV